MEDAVANQEVARSEEASTPRARATVVKEPPTAWPATGDGEHTLPPPTREAEARALAHAVAVAPCVAHVLARVVHVRATHEHLLLSCETVQAHARRSYWSGKTLQPQQSGLPPILTFFGSQRFGKVVCDDAGGDGGDAA